MKHTAGISIIRTLNISDGLLKDLLEGLWVLKLLLDLGDDGLSKLLLLALLNLSLVTDPGVKNGLSLSGQSGALGDLEGLGLELCGLLNMASEMRFASIGPPKRTLETSKRALVMSTTPPICLTFSMRSLTASVWSARAEFKIPRIFSI